MNDQRENRRILVPFDVGSFLRAPFGWTNRMRRAEGWPERGEQRPRRLGFWGNLVLGVALYGPLLAGAGIGWSSHSGVSWVFFGAAIGFGVQIAVVILVAPVIVLVRARRS